MRAEDERNTASPPGEGAIIDFRAIAHLIPGWIFNEYGQLTGRYVHRDRIVCVAEKGRIQVWVDREAYESRDPDGLICDYDARDLLGMR
jgi:hypothetical protein